MQYKTRNIVDSSKRGLLTRIEKRERVLSLCYVCGMFDTNCEDNNKTVLHFVTKDEQVCAAVRDIIKEVDWFVEKTDPSDKISEKRIYSIENAAGRHHMRFMRKRIGPAKSNFTQKALQYMYSPLFAFALIADRGRYDTKAGRLLVELPFMTDRDAKAMQTWFSNILAIRVDIKENPFALAFDRENAALIYEAISCHPVAQKHIHLIDAVMLNKCE